MFSNKEITAKSKATAFLAELQRIDAAAVATDGEIGAAEGNVAVARARLGDVEAARAIGEESEDPAASGEALAEARSRIDTLTARRESLSVRKCLREDELLAIADELNSEECAERDEKVQAWLREFDKTLASFRAVLLRGFALGEAARWEVMGYLRDSRLRDPRDISRNLLDLTSVTQWVEIDGQSTPTTIAVWQTEPSAVKLHDELAPKFAPYKQARELINALQKRSHEAERQRLLHEAFQGVAR